VENKTILVAVSDVFFYTKVRDALKPQGYTLEKVRVTGEITERAGAVKPAAVILNMNDDRLDAFQALVILKSDERYKSIPVLAFANHEEVDHWKRAQQMGVAKIVSRNEFSSRTLALVEEVIKKAVVDQA
jgi:PleD family two-component response regulator